MTHVKICCISSLDEARLALASGASSLGLVSAMPSGPGVLEEDEIAAIIHALPEETDTFLLTSKTELGALSAQVATCRPRTVQLCDRVALDTRTALKERFPQLSVVQVIHVTGEDSVREAIDAAGSVDRLLLDSGKPDAAQRTLGGTGDTHDWALSKAIVEAVDVPVYLAGGLRPDNVAAAIRRVGPYGVDLCTGVRTEGKLDEAKLASFFEAVRSAS